MERNNRQYKIWNADTGQCTQTIPSDGNRPSSVAFSHNSTLIATASDNAVHVWRTDIGECVQELRGHSDSVNSVIFLHNSSLIASASKGKTVKVWRINTGEIAQELKGHSDSVNLVAFSHNSTLIASASRDHTVIIWTTSTCPCIRKLQGHSFSVSSVAFSHDAALVASATDDNVVTIWHVDTGECIQVGSTKQPPLFLSFGHRNTRLMTNTGPRIISSATWKAPATSPSTQPNTPSDAKIGLSRDGSWVTWNERNLLWLPVEFRPFCSAVQGGDTVVIGTDSGKVIVLRLCNPYPIHNG